MATTLAKSNYSPYEIDFPDGPTGGFTNGATVVDFICKSKFATIDFCLNCEYFNNICRAPKSC